MSRIRTFSLSCTLSCALVAALGGPVLAAPEQAMDSSSGIIALDSLPNPPATLATAKVVDDKGITVGAVQKVVMDPSGKPASVTIALMGTDTVVAMDANGFNYDQGHNVLMAHMDAKQIAAQPPTTG